MHHAARSSSRVPPDEKEYRKYEKWKKKNKMSKSDARGRIRKKSRNHKMYRQRKYYRDDDSDLTGSSSSSYDKSYRTRDSRRTKRHLNKEHDKMLQALRAEVEELRQREEERNCFNRFFRWIRSKYHKTSQMLRSFFAFCANFISNLPLTIGAIALAIVTLGIAWFQFAEEMMDSCRPVHFHSNQCTFAEFPGCFYCDTTTRYYKIALNFHLSCSVIAGLIALLFVAKIFIAKDVVMDEMNSPTTASPAGLFCMTLVCVFAGKGWIGQVMVTIAATLHFCIAIWFILVAQAYNILPDPSWYPNTVGIGISAVKMWLYHPMPGHLLMAVSFAIFDFTCIIALSFY
jgi:hypothetical protein